MIFLTGDVHNHNPTQDGPHRCQNEAFLALKFARLAAEAGIKVTLFATGMALREEEDKFRLLLDLGNVELGAHGWDSFRYPRLRTAAWCLAGTRYGPRWFQAFELARTMRAFRNHIGIAPTSWRGHAYYTDENTYSLLQRAGIKVVSDRIVTNPYTSNTWAHQSVEKILPKLWSLPINSTPDHDGFYHGDLPVAPSTLTYQRKLAMKLRNSLRHVYQIQVMPWSGEILYEQGGAFPVDPRKWETNLQKQIELGIANVGFVTLLLHPVCMQLLDEMSTLRRILNFCRHVKSAHVSQAELLERNRLLAFQN